MKSLTTDFLVIGAGVVGVSIARELKLRYPKTSVTILEKEKEPGLHSSGRNSGVLHSGIYYPPDSLKAKVCTQGAREMAEYCQEHKLPLNRLGKLLIPVNTADVPQLDLLETRAKANGIQVERLDTQQLYSIEPEVRSANGEALFVAQTAVVNSQKTFGKLVNEAKDLGIAIQCNNNIHSVDPAKRILQWGQDTIHYGHIINAAGLHADTVAQQFGIGKRYTLLPFKGIYWKLDPSSGIRVNHLIYPVPDLRVPFLGVHTTTSTEGITYLGPTAVPAFGRENYRGLQDVTLTELLRINKLLIQQFVANQDGFRRLTWQEGRRYFKPWFAQAAQALLPRLQAKHLLPSDKVGIRSQILDQHTGKLVNDFLVEHSKNATHILNAISPAFTSAFPFARYICDHYIEKRSL
jgi:L-2-hydroxyglutarate oxidase LhgO